MAIESRDPSSADSSGQDERSFDKREGEPESELTVSSSPVEPDTEQTRTSGVLGRGGTIELPQLLGDFDLVQEIGRGGMGVVYEARQRSLGKRVAVKVLPYSTMLDQRIVKRFQTEAWAAAQLEHKNIVPVYQVGKERGIHFYAMQFIEGIDLGALYVSLSNAAKQRVQNGSAGASSDRKSKSQTKRDSTHRSDSAKKETLASPQLVDYVQRNGSAAGPKYLKAIVNMGIQVADALHYAHEMGIVHRDIKPSNLLLDHEGDVWVSDFGLAQIESDPGLTASGAMVGTLRYMSPEQVLGKRVGVDHRTDIYSLGVTIYELLTLKRAFSGDGRDTIIRKITFDAPVAPRKIDRRIPIELQTIVTKALSKNPADRYQTAAEMADDFRRFRNNEPIKGRKPSVVQRLARWAQRNRTFVASAASLLLVTFIAAIAITGVTLNLYSVTATALATEQAQKSELERMFQQSEGLRLAASSSVELKNDPMRSLLLATEAATRHPGSSTNGAILQALDTGHEFLTLAGHNSAVGHVAFSADGRRLVSSCVPSRFDPEPYPAIIWDTSTGALVGKLNDTQTITSAMFSPDAFRILTTSSPKSTRESVGVDGDTAARSPTLWDAVNRTKLLTFKSAFLFEVHPFVFDPRGRRAVFPSLGNSAVIYDCVAGHELVKLKGHDRRVVFAAFNAKGDQVVTASDDNTVRVWDAASGKVVHVLDLWKKRDPNKTKCVIDSVEFRPNGRQLVTASRAYGIHLWDLTTGERINQQHLKGGFARYWPAAPQLLTYFPSQREMSIRNPSTGNSFATAKMNSGLWGNAEISPDGQWIAVQGDSDLSAVSIWHADARGVESDLKGHQSIVNDIAFSPNSKLIATGSADKTVRLWHLANGGDRMTFPTRAWSNAPLATASPDGKQVAIVARNDGAVGRILDFDQVDLSVEIPGRIWMPNGTSTRFVSAIGRRLAIHSMADRSELKSVSRPHGRIVEAAINRDGDRVAAAASSQTLILWFPDEDRQVLLATDTSQIYALRFNEAGDRLAAAGADGSVRIWDADSGAPLADLQCDALALDVVFSIDDTLIAATTNQGRALVWDAKSFAQRQVLSAPEAEFQHLEFSFDGKYLVSYQSFQSKAVHVWDVENGTLEATLEVTGDVHVALHPSEHETLITSPAGAFTWQYEQDERRMVSEEPMARGRYYVDGSELMIASAVSLMDQPWQIVQSPARVRPLTLQRWRRDDLELLGSTEFYSERIYELFVSGDGLGLMSASRMAEIVNHDAETGEVIGRMPGHAAQISACLFTSDSKHLVTSSWDQTISVWNPHDGSRQQVLVGHQAAINALALGHEDRRLVSGDDDGRCIVWNLESGQSLHQVKFSDAGISEVALNNVGDKLLVISADASLFVYDLKEQKIVELEIGANQIEWAEFSPDGKSILIVPRTVIQSEDAQGQGPDGKKNPSVLIAPTNGDPVSTIEQEGNIATAHFHHNSRQIITATREGEVAFYDIATGQAQRRFPSGGLVKAAVVSKSGEYVAVLKQDRLIVWQVEKPSEWISMTNVGSILATPHQFAPFVEQAGIMLIQRDDNLQFRRVPIDLPAFSRTVISRSLSAREKTQFYVE